MTPSTTISTVKNTLWDLLFPPSDSEVRIRALVATDFAELRVPETPEEWIFSTLPYKDEMVHDLIYALKFERSSSAFLLSAQILEDELTNLLSDMQQLGRFLNPIICPIPISRKRLKERHYDQIKMLLSSTRNKQSYEIRSLLRRLPGQIPQSHTTSRKERLENVHNAYEVKDPRAVWDKEIILIDDVTTTGATLREARRILLQAGARDVIALTLAH